MRAGRGTRPVIEFNEQDEILGVKDLRSSQWSKLICKEDVGCVFVVTELDCLMVIYGLRTCRPLKPASRFYADGMITKMHRSSISLALNYYVLIESTNSKTNARTRTEDQCSGHDNKSD
jgi:hypothetical protein